MICFKMSNLKNMVCEQCVCVPILNNLIPLTPNNPGQTRPILFNYCPDMYKVFIFVNCIFLKKCDDSKMVFCKKNSTSTR